MKWFFFFFCFACHSKTIPSVGGNVFSVCVLFEDKWLADRGDCDHGIQQWWTVTHRLIKQSHIWWEWWEGWCVTWILFLICAWALSGKESSASVCIRSCIMTCYLLTMHLTLRGRWYAALPHTNRAETSLKNVNVSARFFFQCLLDQKMLSTFFLVLVWIARDVNEIFETTCSKYLGVTESQNESIHLCFSSLKTKNSQKPSGLRSLAWSCFSSNPTLCNVCCFSLVCSKNLLQ